MPEEQYEEDHEETPSTPSREGFFTRVRKFFGSDDEQPPAPMDEPAPEPDVHEACREDIKTIGKIALDILRALPDKELVGFKNSDQYAQLKRILGKHNLIKSE